MDSDDTIPSPTILSRVPEDMDMEEDGDDGLIKFDYRRHVRLYTLLVPTTTLVAFALCTIPLLLASSHTNTIRTHEVLTATALWALSYTIQKHINIWSPWWQLSAVLRAATHTLLLLGAPYLLRTAHSADYPMPSKHDERAYLRTWVVGLTWALVEAVVSIRHAYEVMALYRPRMLVDEPVEEDDYDEEASVVSNNLSYLETIHKRSEIEDALAGVAFIDIPLFILALQRVAAILLSLGTTLLLSAAWYPRSYWIVEVLGCFLVQTLVGVLRAPQVRVYVGMVVGLMAFFAGLGIWGVLE